MTRSVSAGWPPPGPASSRSASGGAASTSGEVAIGGVGTASSVALSGGPAAASTDMVDSGTHTSGGAAAPGKGTGCSACWAWSWVSDSTLTWTQRPPTNRCWPEYEAASWLNHGATGGAAPTVSVPVGPVQGDGPAGESVESTRTAPADAAPSDSTSTPTRIGPRRTRTPRLLCRATRLSPRRLPSPRSWSFPGRAAVRPGVVPICRSVTPDQVLVNQSRTDYAFRRQQRLLKREHS